MKGAKGEGRRAKGEGRREKVIDIGSKINIVSDSEQISRATASKHRERQRTNIARNCEQTS